MRVRIGLCAVLVATGLMLVGCGDGKTNDPPPEADTDTPNVEIDEGSIPAPGDPTTEDGGEKKASE